MFKEGHLFEINSLEATLANDGTQCARHHNSKLHHQENCDSTRMGLPT